MKYFIYQGNDHDCGFAALKMFLATIAKDKSYLYIPKPSKREYYSLEDLSLISKVYGVPLDANACSKDYYDFLKGPCLALVDDNHIVMVKKRKKKSILIYDPGRGIIKMKKDEFLRRWRGVILEATSPTSILKIDKIRQNLLPQKINIFSYIISLISTGLLIGSFYLLNKIQNFVFSLVFLMLFVTSQLVEKFLLYKQIYTFDKEYIPKYFEIKKNCSKEGYIKYNDYKKHFFTNNRQSLASLLLAFTITFLLCFNDFRNVFVLLALILIKLLEIIVFSRPDQDLKGRIAEIENCDFKEQITVKEMATSASGLANKYLFTNSIKEIFYIFISFSFAITMMFVTQNIGCNYVIFHFVMYYAGFVSYNQLLNNLSNKKETDKMERRFFDSCNL